VKVLPLYFDRPADVANHTFPDASISISFTVFPTNPCDVVKVVHVVPLSRDTPDPFVANQTSPFVATLIDKMSFEAIDELDVV
jgi:hypothetical protein